MMGQKKVKRILWYEALGFSMIIALSWVDELVSLPYRLFGGVGHSDWRESALETIVVLLVWGLIHYLTKRLLTRVYYLEGFLRVCAWCRKVGYDDDWVQLEDYFSKGFNIKTSHSVCPQCAEKIKSGATEADRAGRP